MRPDTDTMPTVLHLRNERPTDLPPGLADDDVRYAPALVEHFVGQYTQPGDIVFDPFCGFGTTLLVAEAMGRVSCGVELLPKRVAYIRRQLREPSAIRQGDARHLDALDLPSFDLSITSPPFRTRANHPQNPLDGYRTQGNSYGQYIDDLTAIYAQVRSLMKPEALVVIEAANLRVGEQVTPLAWDIARAVSRVLTFQGETVVAWDQYGFGYDHSYCLTFTV